LMALGMCLQVGINQSTREVLAQSVSGFQRSHVRRVGERRAVPKSSMLLAALASLRPPSDTVTSNEGVAARGGKVQSTRRTVFVRCSMCTSGPGARKELSHDSACGSLSRRAHAGLAQGLPRDSSACALHKLSLFAIPAGNPIRHAPESLVATIRDLKD